MWILSLEFSSSRKGVCLYSPQSPEMVPPPFQDPLPGSFIAVDETPNSLKPFQLISTVLEKAGIAPNQVDRIAIGLGPGSYTGIRVAIAVAMGWKLASSNDKISFHGIPSYNSIIATAYLRGVRGDVAVVIDAYQNELYVAKFVLDNAGWKNTLPLQVIPASKVHIFTSGSIVVGPTPTKWVPHGIEIHPEPAYLAYEAAFFSPPITSPSGLTPIYLKPPAFKKSPPARKLPI